MAPTEGDGQEAAPIEDDLSVLVSDHVVLHIEEGSLEVLGGGDDHVARLTQEDDPQALTLDCAGLQALVPEDGQEVLAIEGILLLQAPIEQDLVVLLTEDQVLPVRESHPSVLVVIIQMVVAILQVGRIEN